MFVVIEYLWMQQNKTSISTGYNLNTYVLNFFFPVTGKTTQVNLQKYNKIGNSTRYNYSTWSLLPGTDKKNSSWFEKGVISTILKK